MPNRYLAENNIRYIKSGTFAALEKLSWKLSWIYSFVKFRLFILSVQIYFRNKQKFTLGIFTVTANLTIVQICHVFQELVLQWAPRLESERYQRVAGAEKGGTWRETSTGFPANSYYSWTTSRLWKECACRNTVRIAPYSLPRTAYQLICRGMMKSNWAGRWTWTRVLAHVPHRWRMHDWSVFAPFINISSWRHHKIVLRSVRHGFCGAAGEHYSCCVRIVLHKSLRNDLAVRLLLNVAVCDAHVALDSILLARFNPAKMSIKHMLDQLQGNDDVSDLSAINKGIKKLTHIMGPILTCAVVSHIFGSGISMLDKFFKIVFAINPDLRIGRKTAEASSPMLFCLSSASREWRTVTGCCQLPYL